MNSSSPTTDSEKPIYTAWGCKMCDTIIYMATQTMVDEHLNSHTIKAKTDEWTNLPNELKEEWLKDFKDVQYMDLPIHESILEKQWDWITTHFLKTKICEICGVQVSPYDHFCHGSKSYPHDYIKNNQDIIAGRTK